MAIMYKSEKAIVAFFKSYLRKKRTTLRLASYAKDEHGTPLLNSVCEFSTLENHGTAGLFTKRGRLRASVKLILKKMFARHHWIEVKEINYEGYY